MAKLPIGFSPLDDNPLKAINVQIINHYWQDLFNKAGIGTPHEDIEVNDTIIFGFMVAQFLADFRYKQTLR